MDWLSTKEFRYFNVGIGLDSIIWLFLGLIIGYLFKFYHREKVSDISQYSTEMDSKTLLNTSEISQTSNGPKHIAVIMDGNRRYGRKKHNDPLRGHWDGGQTLVNFCDWCAKDGVKQLTVYAFSTENWGRDKIEVDTLMSIFSKYAEKMRVEAISRNVCVRIITTDNTRLTGTIKESIDALESSTKHCDGFIVNICLSYGSRGEIVNACQSIVNDSINGNLSNNAPITEELFSKYLQARDEPDVLIRTSGEYRISNFLLWQLAYTEMFFIDKNWPEITQLDVKQIIKEYQDRKRRFGL
jgi:undecaprenyl diphosphate synthase